MPIAVPSAEPAQIVAGDTVKWLKTLDDFLPSDGWVLSYVLINASAKIAITAAPDGQSHLVSVSASTTANWTVGDYQWRSRASKGTEVYTVGDGRVSIKASFSASTYETRSQTAIMLDAVNQVLLKTASQNVLEYEIAGRRLKHYDMAGLLRLRDKLGAELKAEQAAERVAAGLGNPGRIRVRF